MDKYSKMYMYVCVNCTFVCVYVCVCVCVREYLSCVLLYEVMSWMHNAILATDIALFHSNKTALQTLLADGTFDWSNTEHRCVCVCVCVNPLNIC